MKNKQIFLEIYKLYKGEIIGSAIGAIFAILVIIIGFWKTIFIGICTALGFYIGRKLTNKDELLELLDRILPKNKF